MSEENKIEEPTHYIISKEAIHLALNTLAALPYSQVSKTIESIQGSLRPHTEEKKDNVSAPKIEDKKKK